MVMSRAQTDHEIVAIPIQVTRDLLALIVVLPGVHRVEESAVCPVLAMSTRIVSGTTQAACRVQALRSAQG
jgi:hypothetical protein